MKVLILTTSYPLDKDSSSGIFVYRLVQNLPLSVQAKTLVPDDSRPSPEPMGQNNIIKFRYAPKTWQLLAHNPGGIPVALRQHKWLYILLPAFLASMTLSCIIHARNTSLIHANWSISGLVAGLAGLLWRIPVITTIRGEDLTRARKNWLDRQILSLCIKLNRRVITVSQAILEWAIDAYPEQKQKFFLVENGVADEFHSIGKNRSYTKNKSLHLLTVGSLIARKQIHTIIHALGLLDSDTTVHLDIVGNGDEMTALRTLTEQLKISDRVHFHDHISPHHLPEIFAQADIFILASSSEGRPNVILEAMASGLPVVASDIEGVNELVSEATGRLFPVGDSHALAGHIRALLEDSSLRQRLGRAGHDFIQHKGLSWQQTGTKYFMHYKQITDKSCVE